MPVQSGGVTVTSYRIDDPLQWLSTLREPGRCLGSLSLPDTRAYFGRSHRQRRHRLAKALMRLDPPARTMVLEATRRVRAGAWRGLLAEQLQTQNPTPALELAAWLAVERLHWLDGHRCPDDARLCAAVLAHASTVHADRFCEMAPFVVTATYRVDEDSETDAAAAAWVASWREVLAALERGGMSVELVRLLARRIDAVRL